MSSKIQDFIIPKFTWAFAIRLLILVIFLPLFCIYVCRPAWVNGDSMLPAYHTGEFLPVWRPAYWFGRTPQPGDVVMIKYVGEKVMFLKRVVATEGQTICFRDGQLFIDEQPCVEFWGRTPHCTWTLPPHKVAEGCVYVVGDNRSMPIQEHLFGETSISRIVGKALW